MLCSISTQKPGSNWLDRLRSSKGFPSADHNLNLEQFLTHHTHNESDVRESNNTGSESSSDPIRSSGNQAPEAPHNSGDNNEVCNVVNNVLSELFCMGESGNFHFKKGSRKQTNPRFCASTVSSEIASPMSDDNSGVEIKGSELKLLEQGHDLELAEEGEDKSHHNLLGFSRSEVTVIDTSCSPWKFEKLLFRKRNIWKVRDKKSKTLNASKKRKKADVVNGGDKRHKLPVNEKLAVSDTSKEACKRTSDAVGQACKKKQGKLKLKKASSSVVLIKSIPTSKKYGTGINKHCLKPS